MEDFRFISLDTVDQLSLHDCECSRLWFDGESLILDMEWMEVLSSHPDNPYDKAHQSTEGRIILTDPVILSGSLTVRGCQEDREIQTLEKLDLGGFEILDFDGEPDGDRFRLRIFAAFSGSTELEYIELTLTYSSSTVMFSELTTESWFEDEKFKG